MYWKNLTRGEQQLAVNFWVRIMYKIRDRIMKKYLNMKVAERKQTIAVHIQKVERGDLTKT